MQARLTRWIRQAALAWAWGLLGAMLPAVAQRAAPPAVQALAQEATDDFRRWIEPPLVQYWQFGLLQREAGDPVRRLLRQQHAETVAALLALAARPEQAKLAGNALRRLAHVGNAKPAEELLTAEADRLQAQDPRAAAALRRHVLALRVLPQALWLRANPTGQADDMLRTRAQTLFGRHPATAAAGGLDAVLRADPADAAAWLMRLWLPGPALPDAAWARALAAVEADGDPHLLAAWLEAMADRQAAAGDTERSLVASTEAWRRIDQAATAGDPRVKPRDRALALGRLAQRQRSVGQPAAALASWQRALALRSQLADADRADVALGVDLAAAHRALAQMPGLPAPQRQQHGTASFQVFNALAERDRYTPSFDAASWSGMASTYTLLAGLLTLAGGLLLLALYRWRLRHWMARAAGAAAPPAAAGPTRAALLQLAPLATGPAQPDPRRGATLVLGLAGAALSAVATVLTLTFNDTELLANRVFTVFWAYLLGTVVVLWLLWAGARRARVWLVGLYLGGLVVLSVRVGFSSTPPLTLGPLTFAPWSQPLLFWAMAAGPFLLLPLLLWRPVRAVGPVLVALVLPACLGGALAQVAFSTQAGIHAMAAVGMRTGAPFLLLQFAVFAAGMLAALPLAAAVAWGLRRAEDAGWLNDLTLVADTVWLFQTLGLCLSLALDSGRDAVLGLLAWLAGRAVLVLGGLVLRRRALRRPARRLLLLRVFGQPRSSRRLFDSLQARWAWLGPIRMIAAPDLAGSTIGPGELVDFVTGRMRRHFVVEPAELAPRLQRLHPRPDASGRYAVDDLFCGNDTWRPAVQALMQASDLVVMDLRGFQQRHLGCRYELGELLDLVPGARIVLLVDGQTDRPLLERTLAERAAQLAAASPNLPGPVQVGLVEVGDDVDAAVQQLLAHAARLQAGADPGTQDRPLARAA